MVFSFHRSKKRPNAWCNCSKTKNCAKKLEAKAARLCARNFCLRATSSSTSISLARSTKTFGCGVPADPIQEFLNVAGITDPSYSGAVDLDKSAVTDFWQSRSRHRRHALLSRLPA